MVNAHQFGVVVVDAFVDRDDEVAEALVQNVGERMNEVRIFLRDRVDPRLRDFIVDEWIADQPITFGAGAYDGSKITRAFADR